MSETTRPVTTIVVAVVVALVVGAVLVARLGDATDDAARRARFRQAAAVSPLPGEIGTRAGWNRSAFINDNLWTEGEVQFAVWVDAAGNPVVGRRQGAEGPWETTDLGALAGNPFAAPTVADPHNVYAVGVDGAGYVHIAGNMHGDPLRYVRSKEPFDISAWVQPAMVASDEDSVSYPAFARAPGGPLLFFYRDGGAGRGDVRLNRLDGASWRRVGTLVDGRSSDESPYLQRIAVDSVRGTIHVMFLWRAGEDAESNRDVSYLRSDDGGSVWRTSDGSEVSLPVTRRTADVVTRTEDGSPALLNQGGLAVDEAGRPHAVFRTLGPAARSNAVHVWQDADGWQTEPVGTIAGMAGRPALLGSGSDPLLVLWSEREGDHVELRVARLDGRRTTSTVALASLPVAQWEPTFDSAAALRGQLRMLLPSGAVRTGGSATPAAVVTWSLAALASP